MRPAVATDAGFSVDAACLPGAAICLPAVTICEVGAKVDEVGAEAGEAGATVVARSQSITIRYGSYSVNTLKRATFWRSRTMRVVLFGCRPNRISRTTSAS